jgi:eukaryotic-like serine/threonine-protein kinase
MAEVQLALQRGPAGFEKLVVVKLVHENLATQRAFVDMLLDEARVAALVKHPNVVDIYDLGEVEGRYFIAMEYLEGEPLLAVLRAGRDGQRLDVLSTARLVADTAEGLDAAHELRSMAGDPIGLVHHDVSLGNIVVLYNGQVKLVDFGVAKATQSATARTKVQGKFGYMAPEKLRGGPGDRRSDIWSLGCVLWESLTLKRLFKGGNDSDTMQQVLECPVLAPSDVNGDVPVDFDAIAMRALERDPDKRYPTAKAMAADLEEVLRKHGYAAKNDTIAKYMQVTFQSHIAARKKLLQEVSSKGGASRDVLEAAFDGGALAAGGRLLSTGEFKRRPPTDTLGPLAVVAEHTPNRVTEGTTPVFPKASREELARFAGPPEPRKAAPASPAHDGGDEQTVVEPEAVVPRARWTMYAAGAALVLAAVIVASVLVGGGTQGASRLDILNTALVARDARPAAVPPVGEAPSPSPSPGAPAAGVAPEVVVTDVEAYHDAHPPSAVPEPDGKTVRSGSGSTRHAQTPRLTTSTKATPDKLSADEIFKTGLQAWVHGDTKAALASYKRVLLANPGFAPAWRGVGLVYEKLGDKTASRAAFQKYLQIAPGALDAAGIRARLEAP